MSCSVLTHNHKSVRFNVVFSNLPFSFPVCLGSLFPFLPSLSLSLPLLVSSLRVLSLWASVTSPFVLALALCSFLSVFPLNSLSGWAFLRVLSFPLRSLPLSLSSVVSLSGWAFFAFPSLSARSLWFPPDPLPLSRFARAFG